MDRPSSTRSLMGIALVAAWALALVGPPLALSGWREGRLAALTAPGVQADWDEFRSAMRRESGRDGPVQRKVPKSPEPPELVWLRDYFGLAVVAWIILAGVLGGFLVFVAVGTAGNHRHSLPENQPAGDRNDQKQDQRDAENADERKHDQAPS